MQPLERAVSLRALLLLAAAAVMVFVAMVAVALAFRVIPSANMLARRTTLTQADYRERTQASAALDSVMTDLRQQLRLARITSPNRDSLAKRRERIESLIFSSATLAPLRRDTRLSPEIAALLERADEAAMDVAGTMLGAIGYLEVDDLENAERVLLLADSLDSPLTMRLNAVTLATLTELTRDEERLVSEARTATTLVVGWLTLGVVLLPVLWWILNVRLFAPLIALDRSLSRIERGELDVELRATRDDEIGRLRAHFNRTTNVLRKQRLAAERAAANEALSVSEAHYRSAFDQAAVGLAEMSMDRKYLRINRAMTRILGRTEEEILGRTFLDFTHPADIEPNTNAWHELHRPGSSLVPFNKRYVRPDGSTASVQITATIIRAPDGTPRHVLTVIHDVTEQRRLERHMVQTSKMDAVGQLAGGVAHDFNNLLTGIIGFADLLEHDTLQSPEARDDAAAIRGIALRGAELASSLLAMARRNTHREEPFALEPLLRESYELIQRTFDRRIEVRMEVAVAATILGDRSLISNALLNLALNARDAMPDGGVLRLAAGVESFNEHAAHVRGLTAAGEYVVLEVEDNGVGMPSEVTERVFEPFYTTKPQGKGTGLGLAMVYGTVQSHRGVIQVDSTPGKGTRFTIYLPRVQENAPDIRAINVPLTAPVPARVLIVDDEESLRTVAERMLKRLGYDVSTAGDGLAALEQLAHPDHGFDVILLDGNMPRMNGIETAAELHRQYPDLAMIYCSGHFESDDVVDFETSGFRERLAKPYTMEALSRAVARCVTPVGSLRTPGGLPETR